MFWVRHKRGPLWRPKADQSWVFLTLEAMDQHHPTVHRLFCRKCYDRFSAVKCSTNSCFMLPSGNDSHFAFLKILLLHGELSNGIWWFSIATLKKTSRVDPIWWLGKSNPPGLPQETLVRTGCPQNSRLSPWKFTRSRVDAINSRETCRDSGHPKWHWNIDWCNELETLYIIYGGFLK